MNVIEGTLQNPLIGIVDEDASIRTITLSGQDRAPRVIFTGAHEGEDEKPVAFESGPRGVFAQTGQRTGVVHRDHQSVAAAFEVRIAHAILAIRL